jgi:hypothetical protein
MSELWVGVFEVLEGPLGQLLGGRSGAFVNAIGLGDSAETFVESASNYLENYGFVVKNIAEVGLVAGKVEQNQLVPALLELIGEVSEANPIVFGVFHAFDDSE